MLNPEGGGVTIDEPSSIEAGKAGLRVDVEKNKGMCMVLNVYEILIHLLKLLELCMVVQFTCLVGQNEDSEQDV